MPTLAKDLFALIAAARFSTSRELKSENLKQNKMNRYEPCHLVFNNFGECINGAEALSRSAQALYDDAIKIDKLTLPQKAIKVKRLDEI